MSSVGMRHEVKASSSRACSGVRTSKTGLPDFATWRACSAAETIAGQLPASHPAPTYPESICRKSRRLDWKEFMITQQCKKFKGYRRLRQGENPRGEIPGNQIG